MKWEDLTLYRDPQKCAYRAFVNGDHIGDIAYSDYLDGCLRLSTPRLRVSEEDARREAPE